MNISFRDARLEDASTLDRIFDTTFCSTFGHLYRAEDLEGHRWMFMQRPCISGGWTEYLSRWAFFACVAVRWRLGSRVVVDATGLRRRSLSASTQLYKQAVIALPDC